MSLEGSIKRCMWISVVIVACDAGTPPRTPIPVADTNPPPSNAPSAPEIIVMPGSPPGIGFGELRFSSFSDFFDAVVVPAGRAGSVALIDPASNAVKSVDGFSSNATYSGANDFGVISAEGAFDGLFAVDRTSKKLFVAHPLTAKIVGSVPLAATPESVRSFAPLRQVWVTQPEKVQIEIFAVGSGGDAAFSTGQPPVQEAVIKTEGGPQALVFDVHKSRGYALLRNGTLMSIDAFEGKVVGRWATGCETARALDADSRRGFIFVGCAEGSVVVLDATDGHRLATMDLSSTVDAIAYTDEPARFGHVYVASAQHATLTILGTSTKGELSMLGLVPTVTGARCVVPDKSGHVYVCDPDGGRILKLRDPYPPSR